MAEAHDNSMPTTCSLVREDVIIDVPDGSTAQISSKRNNRDKDATVEKTNVPKTVVSKQKVNEIGHDPAKVNDTKMASSEDVAILRELAMEHIYPLKMLEHLAALIKQIPKPCQVQLDAISELIELIESTHGITQEERTIREKVAGEFEQLINKAVPGTKLTIFGSTLSGFALKGSNLDIDMEIPSNTTYASALLNALKMIKEQSIYSNISNDLSCSYPSISFNHNERGVRITIWVSSSSSVKTNVLLSHYNSLDKRVKPMVTAFRYWAKLCAIDDQHKGTFPSHSFIIMVIHFLQSTTPPVLPVLHERRKENEPDAYATPEELDPPWSSLNTSSLGKLWVEMLEYYSIQFKMFSHIINIRFLLPLVKKEKESKRISMEDPFFTKRNLARSASSVSVCQFVIDRLRFTYKYFAVPQLQFGCLYKQVRKQKGDVNEVTKPIEDNTKAQEERMAKSTVEEEDDEDDEEEEENDNNESLHPRECEAEAKMLDCVDDAENNMTELSLDEEKPVVLRDVTDTLEVVSWKMANALLAQLEREQLKYTFTKENFAAGRKVPLFCTTCQKKDHDKSSCKEDELPPPRPLPHFKESYNVLLTNLLCKLTEDFAPKERENAYRENMVQGLQTYIRQTFPGAELRLFGSSANGFGFFDSDLDICLTFEGFPIGKEFDHITIIEQVAEELKKSGQCHQVIPITTAKVPIVKFTLKTTVKSKLTPQYLEADLSLYNTLALQNTRLLNTYANIDARVKALGYTLKYYAKLCEVGDASRGSLSSYAYILMIIHYLQQCNPPVIPVLQQLYDSQKAPPELMIAGWNTWFYEDLKNLPKVWKPYGRNRQKVGELWVNMIRYYTEVFNWRDCVITIRQLEPLYRLDKLWMTQCIAIEDPFDTSHNLGAGLSRRMNAYIMKAFLQWRTVFGACVEAPPRGYWTVVEFLSDVRLLTVGTPPNDRTCRICRRIGHIAKNCPNKKKEWIQTEKSNEEKKETDKNGRINKSPKKINEVQEKMLQDLSQKKDSAGMLQGVAKGITISDLGENQFDILENFLNHIHLRNHLISIGYRIYPRELFNPFEVRPGSVVFRVPCKPTQDPIFMVNRMNVPVDVFELQRYQAFLDEVLRGLGKFLREREDDGRKPKPVFPVPRATVAAKYGRTNKTRLEFGVFDTIPIPPPPGLAQGKDPLPEINVQKNSKKDKKLKKEKRRKKRKPQKDDLIVTESRRKPPGNHEKDEKLVSRNIESPEKVKAGACDLRHPPPITNATTASAKTTISPNMLFEMANAFGGGTLQLRGGLPIMHIKQHYQKSPSSPSGKPSEMNRMPPPPGFPPPSNRRGLENPIPVVTSPNHSESLGTKVPPYNQIQIKGSIDPYCQQMANKNIQLELFDKENQRQKEQQWDFQQLHTNQHRPFNIQGEIASKTEKRFLETFQQDFSFHQQRSNENSPQFQSSPNQQLFQSNFPLPLERFPSGQHHPHGNQNPFQIRQIPSSENNLCLQTSQDPPTQESQQLFQSGQHPDLRRFQSGLHSSSENQVQSIMHSTIESLQLSRNEPHSAPENLHLFQNAQRVNSETLRWLQSARPTNENAFVPPLSGFIPNQFTPLGLPIPPGLGSTLVQQLPPPIRNAFPVQYQQPYSSQQQVYPSLGNNDNGNVFVRNTVGEPSSGGRNFLQTQDFSDRKTTEGAVEGPWRSLSDSLPSDFFYLED